MRYRLVDEADLPACLDLFDRNGRCVVSPRVREHLPRLWAEWLAQGRHFPKPFSLWEDLRGTVGADGSRGPRVEAIGISHFLRDDVHDLLLAEPQPYMLDRLYRMVLDGHSPLLDPREIAQANAGEGLSLAMPLYLQREHDLSHPDSQRLMPLGPAAWYFCHAGYNVRRLVGEVYGRPGGAYMSAGGFRLAHVFDAPAGMPADRPDCEPHQHVLDRRDQPPGAIHPLSLWLLHTRTPMLRLSASLQTVATLALQGDTDRAIAARLGISTDAVKQAWRGILKAVATHMPELCADTTDATADGAAPVRGAEHRRVVIEYLRQHMEELRPWDARVRREAQAGCGVAAEPIASRAHATAKKP